MSQAEELMRLLRDGFKYLSPGPEDTRFSQVWDLFGDIVFECGWRLFEEEFGPLEDAADEVRMYLQHFEKVARVCVARFTASG